MLCETKALFRHHRSPTRDQNRLSSSDSSPEGSTSAESLLQRLHTLAVMQRKRACEISLRIGMLNVMPELPDILAYISALEPRIVRQPIKQVRLASPFLLRTVKPLLESVEGQTVQEIRRVGKRIAIGVENDLWLVLHLMIAGRLH
jgi:hypothetical protein